MTKPSREKFKTYKDVFEERTIRNLFELSSKGYFDEDTMSPISIGKEANIFSAKKDGGKIIIKIYRINTCDFNRMYEILRRDPRFPKLNKKRRKVISDWARREYRNLHKARTAGVSCPTPHIVKENILIMEFIGNEEPSKRIKDDVPNDKKFLNDVISNMKKLNKANLVHGDLSSFNILNHNGKPVFIDFSQAIEKGTSYAEEMFERDIKNIANFFNKVGIKCSEEKIRKKIISKK